MEVVDLYQGAGVRTGVGIISQFVCFSSSLCFFLLVSHALSLF